MWLRGGAGEEQGRRVAGEAGMIAVERRARSGTVGVGDGCLGSWPVGRGKVLGGA